MKTNKILVIIIIVLALLNVTTLTIIWRGHRINESGQRHKHRSERFLKRKLDLTSEQLKLFEKARLEHQAAIKGLLDRGVSIRKELTLNLSSPSPGLRDSLINTLMENQRQIEYQNLAHLQKLREFCTPEQAILFDSVFTKIIENPRMRRGMRR